MAALIVADVWKNFPLVALIALAALQAVPNDIRAAAIVRRGGRLAAVPPCHAALPAWGP